MSELQPFNPDAPEFRLLCQMAAIKPSAFAAALNNPERFSKHISADELAKYLGGVTRINELNIHIHAIIGAALERTLTANPDLKKKMKAKGLRNG